MFNIERASMYKKTVLKNGVRVVTHDIKDRDSVAVGIWIGVGGRYEDDRVKGSAHFLEHIVFKGCRKYNCGQIKEKIEGVGGMLNAFTSEEQTCFYAKIPSKHINITFDVLADMVFHPLISKTDVKKEKTVIVEEIKMYHDLPQYFVIELLDELVWQGHPLGKSLAGTIESVTALQDKDLKGFHRAHYTADNIVVSACGNIQHDKVVQLANKYLGSLNGSGKKEFIQFTQKQDQPRYRFLKKDIEQMHLALGAPGYHERHKDRFAMSLLSIILGGNMSSRLFVEVREKRGLAYSISSSSKTLHDTGLFIIRAGVDNSKIVETVKVVMHELAKIKQREVSKSEFTRGKEYLLGQLLLGLEDTMDHMLWLGESVIAKNEMRTLKEVIDDFNKVTIADIRRVAKEIFSPEHLNLAIVGPISALQENQLKNLIKISE